MIKRIVIFFACTIPFGLFAQDKWDLRKCVDYAMKNNISVKQADVQSRITALSLQQAKLNVYPSAAFSGGLGTQFGRSIDPTTNQFTTTQLLYNNFQLQGGIQVYNWGRLKNTIQTQQFNFNASLVDIEKAANDVALNVATSYLQVLASKEQINISEIQVEQTKQQYNITKKKVDAGALPELNLAEIESQLATDSSNLITAKSTYDINLLSLKALLNLDAALPFEVETPPVDQIPLESFADLQPDIVFQLAMANQPLQKSNDLKIQGGEYAIKAYRAALYPSITLGYNLATSFSNSLKGVDPSSLVFNGYTKTGLITSVNNINYEVLQPSYNYSYSSKSFGNWWQGYGSQIDQNFRQALGFNISVPIFNNGSYKIAYEQSKINLRGLKLQKEQADMTLKQNIYTSYANAIASYEKYIASIKTVASYQKAYDFSVKRYEVGLLPTIDLITNQNNLLKAKLQQLTNHYDYVFKMKLLEFFKGQGLKL